MVMEEKKELRLLLLMEGTAVLSLAFGFFKNDLADGNAWVNGQRHGAGIGHFQNLLG